MSIVIYFLLIAIVVCELNEGEIDENKTGVVHGVFHPPFIAWKDPITDWPTANTFLQYTEPLRDYSTLATCRVRVCDGVDTPVVGETCTNNPMYLVDLLQRIDYTAKKTIMFMVDYDACLMMNREVYRSLVYNRDRKMWFGVRVIRGPKSTRETMLEPRCYANITHDLLMFDEYAQTPEEKIPYTKQQFQDMAKVYNHSLMFRHAVIDHYTATLTHKTEFNPAMDFVPFSAYNMFGQPFPDLTKRKAWDFLGWRMRYLGLHCFPLLAWNMTVQLHSSSPFVHWLHNVAPVQEQFINPDSFYLYLERRSKSLIHLNVQTRDGLHVLNDKENKNLEVRFERALQEVDDSRTMLYSFSQQDYNLTPIDELVSQHHIYILLRVLRGPNSGPNQLQSLDKVNLNLRRAVYIIGFAEGPGPERGYTDAQYTAMAELLQSKQLEGKRVGIHLATEHLVHTHEMNDLDKLYYLMQTKIHYIFVSNMNMAYEITEDEYQYLYYKMVALIAPMFMIIPFNVSRRLYPNILRQIPTTTTIKTTTTKRTTPTTTTTTTPAPTIPGQTTLETTTTTTTTTPTIPTTTTTEGKPEEETDATVDIDDSPIDLLTQADPSTTFKDIVTKKFAFPTRKSEAARHLALGNVLCTISIVVSGCIRFWRLSMLA